MGVLWVLFPGVGRWDFSHVCRVVCVGLGHRRVVVVVCFFFRYWGFCALWVFVGLGTEVFIVSEDLSLGRVCTIYVACGSFWGVWVVV